MAPIMNAIFKVLSTEPFCRLCFNSVQDKPILLQDEVFLKESPFHKTEEIFSMLICVLGEENTQSMSYNDCICTDCLENLTKSYAFVQKTKQNNKFFVNSINTLQVCFENTTEDLASYKHLFVNVDPKSCLSKQYYDNQRAVTNLMMASVRYRSIAFGKYSTRKNTKGSIRKLHDYGEQLNQICKISRKDNQTKFECKVCSAEFSKKFNFNKHYYSQHSEKQVQCMHCDKKYGSEALLKQHLYDSHASIICSECGKAYNNRYSLLYHMRRHSGDQPYECKYCGMKFQWSSRRAEHIRRHHLEPSVECDICHTKFKTLASLYEHRKRHFNPNSRLHVMLDTPPVAEEAVIE